MTEGEVRKVDKFAAAMSIKQVMRFIRLSIDAGEATLPVQVTEQHDSGEKDASGLDNVVLPSRICRPNRTRPGTRQSRS